MFLSDSVVQYLGNSRRYFGTNSAIRYVNQRRLQLLEAEANASPNDASKQAEFYKVGEYYNSIFKFNSFYYFKFFCFLFLLLLHLGITKIK